MMAHCVRRELLHLGEIVRKQPSIVHSIPTIQLCWLTLSVGAMAEKFVCITFTPTRLSPRISLKSLNQSTVKGIESSPVLPNA